MAGLVIAPDLARSLVVERAYVTVPHEHALWNCDCALRKPCQGFLPGQLPLELHTLETMLLEMGAKFQQKLALRGYELAGDLYVHGPWVSMEFNQHITDIESSLWQRSVDENDPSLVLPFVFERDAASPYSDYLLVGNFIVKNTLHDLEA